MSVIWYRVCFDPRAGRENFGTNTQFMEWAREHFSDFNFRTAGFITLDWSDTPNTKGERLWNLLIDGQKPHADGDPNIFTHLAATQWCVDNFDVLLYIKYRDDTHERLFPIREGSPDA